MCVDAAVQLFRSDKVGDASLEIVKGVARICKEKPRTGMKKHSVLCLCWLLPNRVGERESESDFLLSRLSVLTRDR